MRPCTRTFPKAASFASITTSARRRCRTCCTSASPTRSSSRCGTATSSPACRSPWRKRSGSAGAAASTRGPGRAAAAYRTTCCRSWHVAPWSRRSTPRGKRLPVTATEVVVDLKPPPVNVFGDLGPEQPNHVRFRVGPEVAIALGAHTKRPGPVMTGRPIELFLAQQRGDDMDAYEVLISAALIGDTAHFAREDEVEAAWKIVDPVLHPTEPPVLYAPGSWGPPRAEGLLTGPCGWHNP